MATRPRAFLAWGLKVASFVLQVDADETLEIECFDDDKLGGNDFMGRLTFPLRQKLEELPPDARLATWSGDFLLRDVRAALLPLQLFGVPERLSDWQPAPALPSPGRPR